MTIGENVAHYRRARQISQGQLAWQLGWTEYDVDDLEYDAFTPTSQELHTIAGCLGVTPQHLLVADSPSLRNQLARLEQESRRQAEQFQRERVTSLDAFCAWLDVFGFGLVAAAIKTGRWGWDRIRGLWRRVFGR
ncbi:helix-turn-helix transcriptional regulator [Actinoplanes sp. NPDC023936]|uniref:helix-turn-helix domain-containing protein n=1 Tax=Actinoplanes sp. NPDC023936 TaxID=3154910 RepID=UPI0033F14545